MKSLLTQQIQEGGSLEQSEPKPLSEVFRTPIPTPQQQQHHQQHKKELDDEKYSSSPPPEVLIRMKYYNALNIQSQPVQVPQFKRNNSNDEFDNLAFAHSAPLAIPHTSKLRENNEESIVWGKNSGTPTSLPSIHISPTQQNKSSKTKTPRNFIPPHEQKMYQNWDGFGIDELPFRKDHGAI